MTWNLDRSSEVTILDLGDKGVKFRQPRFSFLVSLR